MIATASTRSSELDSLYARARYAMQFQCTPADARARARRASRSATAVIRCCSRRASTSCRSISRCSPSERTLLVSGPNTGGKTVLLKALGLISAMARRAFPAPVGAESRVPVFDDVLRRRRRRAVDRGEPLDVQRAPQEPRRDPPPRDARFARAHRRAGIGNRSAGGRGARLGDSRGAHGARHHDARDHAPRHAQGARDAGAGRRQRVAAVRRRRARADVPAHQGRPRPLVRHQHRAAARPARRRASRAPRSASRRASATWRR